MKLGMIGVDFAKKSLPVYLGNSNDRQRICQRTVDYTQEIIGYI